MNEPLQKAIDFAEGHFSKVPMRFTESEAKVLKAHLQLAYSEGYRDASRDCAQIVKESLVRHGRSSDSI